MSSIVPRVIRVGARASRKWTIKPDDVKHFGSMIGDHNPIHTSGEAAKAAGFPGPICQGMLVASLFSGLMATEIPGPNTVYLSQNLRFVAPVLVADEVEVAVEVTQFRKEKGLIAMNTIVTREDPETKRKIICVEGTAMGMNKGVTFEGESVWSTKI